MAIILEQEDKKIITRTNNTSATFLTEDGLYEVLMQSRKPIADDVAEKLGYTNPTKAINDHCVNLTKRYVENTRGQQRMFEYGFEENVDYVTISQKRLTAQGNETTYTDHILKLDCAKEICMIQRNEKGKMFRKYFIECEKN